MRFFLESFLIGIISAIFRIAPRPAGLALGRVLGNVAYLVASRRRGLALDNLEQALGDEKTTRERETVARRSFQHLGMNLAEFFHLPSMTAEKISGFVTMEGEEHLTTALGLGKGVLVLSGHLGNWDILCATLTLKGYPVALITKTSRSEAVNRLWMKYREDLGIRLLMGRGTMKESLRHLKNNGIVGFVLDQNARVKEGVFVPFFGRQACTLSSLALLARRTGAPVVPMYSYRAGTDHHVVIQPPFVHEPLLDVETDILERTAAYTRWMEKIIRLHPEQWTWLHDRWKTRPRAESNVQCPTSNV